MRKPKIENKYNLTVKDIEKFKLVDKEKLKTRCWRNNVVNAWCYSKGVGKGYWGGSDSDIWVGFYDQPCHKKLIEVNCSCMEGMCNYNFNKFYQTKDIENEIDLQCQEALLEFANWLLDEGVCVRGDCND